MEWWAWAIIDLIIFNVAVVAFLMWRSPGDDLDEHGEDYD